MALCGAAFVSIQRQVTCGSATMPYGSLFNCLAEVVLCDPSVNGWGCWRERLCVPVCWTPSSTTSVELWPRQCRRYRALLMPCAAPPVRGGRPRPRLSRLSAEAVPFDLHHLVRWPLRRWQQLILRQRPPGPACRLMAGPLSAPGLMRWRIVRHLIRPHTHKMKGKNKQTHPRR